MWVVGASSASLGWDVEGVIHGARRERLGKYRPVHMRSYGLHREKPRQITSLTVSGRLIITEQG